MKAVEEDPSGRFIRYDIVLGKGSYKIVYKGFDTHEAVEVAWNKIQVDRIPPDQIRKVQSEVELLGRLNHRNIIGLFHSWCPETKDPDGKLGMDFVTELMSSGTLKEYLTRSRVMKLKVIRRWCYNLLDAIAYLHEQDPPVMHRDLKCDNIFINGHVGEVKIGDLGLSGVKQNNFAHSVIGTPEFMAPELYEEAYTEKVDIYAFGMCMLEMLTMEYPYSECENPAQIFRKVFAGERPMSFQRLPQCEVKQIIASCLEREKRRPSARQLMQHPFFCDWASDDGTVTNLSVSCNKLRPDAPGKRCAEEQNPIQDHSVNASRRVQGDGVTPGSEYAQSSYANLKVGQSTVFNSNTMKRDVLLAREKLNQSADHLEISVSSANDGTELRIAITIPVSGEAKKVEFFFDPNLDDVHEVADEMVEEFRMTGIDAEELAKELQVQIEGHARTVEEEREQNRLLRERDEREQLEEHFRTHARIQAERARNLPERQVPRMKTKSGRFLAPFPPSDYVMDPRPINLMPGQQALNHGIYVPDPRIYNSYGGIVPRGPSDGVIGHRAGPPSAPSSTHSDRHGVSSVNNPTSFGKPSSSTICADEADDKEVMALDPTCEFSRKSFKSNMALMEHCASGRYDMVLEKLEGGANPNYTDYDKRTPLHLAAAEGHYKIVDLLINRGADTELEDRWGSKPIIEAKEHGHEEVVSILMKAGAHAGNNSTSHISKQLMQYCAHGSLDLVKEMLMGGAKATFADKEKRSPLHLACAEGHFEVAKLLLLNGADPMVADKSGSTPVDEAVKNKHLDMLNLLKTFGGIVPIHLMSSEEAEYQRELNFLNMCGRGNVNRVKYLLGIGGKVDYANYDKRTGLHLACAEGHLDVVKFLLEAGANPNVRDRWGTTPTDEAERGKHADVVEAIRQSGGFESGSSTCGVESAKDEKET